MEERTLALLNATLVVGVVLLVCYLCVDLRHARRKYPSGILRRKYLKGISQQARAGFLGTLYYSPACGSQWSGRRRADCRGVSTGSMPSIEVTSKLGNGLCAGYLGVPPVM
jgi:hypothetical protein